MKLLRSVEDKDIKLSVCMWCWYRLQALSWATLDIKVLCKHTVCVWYLLIKFWPGLTENFAECGKRIRYYVGLGLSHVPDVSCIYQTRPLECYCVPVVPLHVCEGEKEEEKKCSFEIHLWVLSDLLNGRCVSRSRNELIVSSPARGTLKREQYIFSLANIYF